MAGAIAVCVGAPVLCASALVSMPAEAMDKVSKKLASYQDEPKGKSSMCATCKYFMAPASCLVVEGTISPQGWCQRFDKRSDK